MKTFVIAIACAASLNLFAQDWKPPVDLVYGEGDGIYMLTYGSTTDDPTFTNKIHAALALPYIKGIAHYQQWNSLEPSPGQFDWRQLDGAVNAVKQHGKKIIIGMQAGVMSPQWLIERADVECIDFVHGNVGWSAWSTVNWTETVGTNTYTVSRMPLPWDDVYNACFDSVLEQIAARYGDESCIEFVNVCGPSVSGGVEANFNVDWAASRAVDSDFDAHLGYTSAKYIAAWKRSIDAHLHIFSNATVGVGLHSSTGTYGFESNAVVLYSAADQMDAARAIRDYFLQQHLQLKGTRGVVRNCGLSDSESLWGDPDTIEDKPQSNFTALQWEVRDSAFVGYESGSVSSINGSDGTPRTVDEFETLIHNGITGCGRHLEIKVPDIVSNPSPHSAYAPYQPVLEEAARILSNSRIDVAAINAEVTGNVDWNSEIWGDPTNFPIIGNSYIHDGSAAANLLGLGDYGSFAGDSLRLDSGAALYNKGSGDLGGTLILNGGRWDTRTYGTAVIDGTIQVMSDSTVLLVDGSMQLNAGLSGASNAVLTIQNFKYAGNRMTVDASDDGFAGTFYVPDSGQLEPWSIQFNTSFTNAALIIAGQKEDAELAAVYCLTNDIFFREIQMPDGTGGLVDLAPGTYNGVGLKLAGVSTNWFNDLGGIITVLGITPPGFYDYTSWAVSLGLGTDSETNDADGDGCANLYEYALGGDPFDSEARGSMPLFHFDAGVLTFSHVRRTDDAWLSYQLQTTSDLTAGDWSNAYYEAVSTNAVSDYFESIFYSISTDETSLFVRLVISANGQQVVVVPDVYQFNSVKQYGAQGDGLVDDTAAIQAALNAKTAKGGGLVWFPAGTYTISSPLIVSRRTSLLGVSDCIIQAVSNMPYMVQTPPYEGGVVTIENLVFDGGADQGVQVDCALDLQDFLSGRVAHVTIQNTSGDGIWSRWTGTLDQSWVNWFVNLDLAVQGYALRLGSSDSYVDGVHVTGGLGLREERYAGNLYRNCIVENCTTGFSISNVYGTALSVSITDCSFVSNTTCGVEFDAAAAFDLYASIDGCLFDGNGQADISLKNCSRIAIRNNSFQTLEPGSGQHIQTTGVVDTIALTGNRFAGEMQAVPGANSVAVNNQFSAMSWLYPFGAGARTDVTLDPDVGAVLDVKNFGAVGNGAADDTAALQAALDAAGPGDTVYFPIGGYKITEPLQLRNSGITILGAGFDNVGSKIIAGTSLLAMMTTPEPISGVRMAKLLFVGRSDLGFVVDHALHLSCLSDSELNRLRFDLIDGDAIVMGYDSARNTIRNCNTHHPSGWGVILQGENCQIDSSYVSGGHGVKLVGEGNHLILNTHMDHADIAGISVDNCTNVAVRNCYFDLNERALSLDNESVAIADVRVESALFRANTVDFYLRNVEGVTIESCASRGTNHFQISGHVDGLNVIGNVFESPVFVPGAGSVVYGNAIP